MARKLYHIISDGLAHFTSNPLWEVRFPLTRNAKVFWPSQIIVNCFQIGMWPLVRAIIRHSGKGLQSCWQPIRGFGCTKLVGYQLCPHIDQLPSKAHWVDPQKGSRNHKERAYIGTMCSIELWFDFKQEYINLYPSDSVERNAPVPWYLIRFSESTYFFTVSMV